MNAIAQREAFCIPARNLIECSQCGGLIQGKLAEVWVFGRSKPPVSALLFQSCCTPDNSYAIFTTIEGVPVFTIPR